MPVRPDMYDRFKDQTIVRDNPFLHSNPFLFDNAKASRRWVVLNDLIGTGLIDYSDLLRKAWQRSARGNDSAWATTPVTELECAELADSSWHDSVRKNQEILRWHSFFEKKYRSLAQQ